MTESYPHDREPSSEPALNKEAILTKLFEIAAEWGIDIEEVDLEDLVGTDDNDFLGNLTTLAIMNGIDHEELLEALGVEVEENLETE